MITALAFLFLMGAILRGALLGALPGILLTLLGKAMQRSVPPPPSSGVGFKKRAPPYSSRCGLVSGKTGGSGQPMTRRPQKTRHS